MAALQTKTLEVSLAYNAYCCCHQQHEASRQHYDAKHLPPRLLTPQHTESNMQTRPCRYTGWCYISVENCARSHSQGELSQHKSRVRIKVGKDCYCHIRPQMGKIYIAMGSITSALRQPHACHTAGKSGWCPWLQGQSIPVQMS